MSNSDNPLKGKQFQHKIKKILEDKYKIDFIEEVPFSLGFPPKEHKFDCVSSDKSIVVECKCYTWTESSNSPSAKFSTLNEAVLYFKLLPNNVEKIIAMKKSINSKRKLSLAQHYVNRNYELLSDIKVLEYDENTDNFTWIYPNFYWLAIENKDQKAFIIFNYNENEVNNTYTLVSQIASKRKITTYNVVEDAVSAINHNLLLNGEILHVDSEISGLIKSEICKLR